jgi:signal transduction histidine kinase
MRNASLGIVLFDTSERQVIFQNAEAASLFSGVVSVGDFAELHGLLIEPLEGCLGSEPQSPPPLRLGPRLIGYTAYASGRFVWTFLRDITEKTRLEAVAEAVELMNNIGYVFSAVRHEIGNPINSVKVALSVLKANYDRFERKAVLEYVERSLAEIQRVEDLLASLKSFSMYEDLRPEPADVEPILRRTVALVSPDFERRGVRLELALDPASRAACLDPRALQQVLLNLLTNAVQALEGRPTPRIVVRCFPLPGRLGIQIDDNGCGLSEEERRHLFKPFWTSKPGGTGLGLVISKKMLAKMNGTIEVESRRGLGTVVTLTLPEAAGAGE